MIMITPLPGVTKTRPGSATQAFPGVEAKILDLAGNEVKVGGGYLAITRPWPAMLRTIWGDDERYVQTYWSKWGKGVYFPGDGAKRDKDGYFWLLGRVDDVMNVAGHRIGTMEVESALVDHPGRRGSRRRRRRRRHEGNGHRRLRHPEGEGQDVVRRGGSQAAGDGARARRQEDRRHRQAGPALLRRRTFPRRARARSCGAFCGTSPRAACSATRPPSPTRVSSRRSRRSTRKKKVDEHARGVESGR